MGIIVRINGVVTAKRVRFGDTTLVRAELDREKASTPGFDYQILDENDPVFIAARTPIEITPFPGVQDQLNAVWKGGADMEAMRVKMQPFIGSPVAAPLAPRILKP